MRELRTHGELPAGQLRAAWLPYLTRDGDTVRARMHELADQL
ncbi:MAG TPA: hypothetical protein VNV66_01235 [Pilimelia sp.]|nr:hypothetical protein [Pilimelia sp.]